MLNGVIRGETNRVKINFEICSRNYRSKTDIGGFICNPKILHMVSLETSDRKVISILKNNNYNLETSKMGMRVRKMFSDINEAWKYAEELQELTGGIIDKKFKVGKYNYQHLPARIVPASHIFPGMYLPVLKGREIIYEKVVERGKKEKEIVTYDLEIEKTHNFIADNIVVHNSIYRFRGAAVSNIIQFRKNYPKTKVVVLTKNYRSTQEILDRSHDLIKFNDPDRLEVVEKINKKLVASSKEQGEPIEFIHSDRVENEADLIAKKIKELMSSDYKLHTTNYQFSDFAILVRANNHSEPITRALSRNGIPFQFLGPGRLFKQPEIIDLISYLKVLYNFEDSVAFYKVLSNEYFDINSRDIAAMGNYTKKYNLSLFESAEKISDVSVTEDTKEKVNKLLGIIKKHLGLIKRETAGQILYYYLEDAGLIQKLLSPTSVEAETRAKNISKFFDKLKTYEVDNEDAAVPAVVDWLDLSMELGESPLATNEDWTAINAVNILTVHSAKGLEFPVVFLANLVSQRFPTIERREQIPIPEELIKEVLPVGDFHLEEERRLFYVGMTRAKEKLYFTAADYYGEGKREKKLSPFIFEAMGKNVERSMQNVEIGEQLSFMDFKPPKSIMHEEYSIKPKIEYLSYSQIETFQTCPLHYKLRYIIKVPTPASASASFGTTIHATLKEFFEEMQNGKKANDKLMYDLLEKNWVKEGYKSKKHEAEFLQKGKDYLVGFLKYGYNPKVLPVALEQPFNLPLRSFERRGDIPLKIGGRFDRIDDLGNGEIEIIDYKTGATIPTQREVDKNLQLSFYALAATKIPMEPFNRVPEKVKLSLYYLDSQEKISTTRTAKQLEEAEKEIIKVRDEIEKSDFKCSGHIFCQMGCEFSLFCREGI
jgi:DNA helicase-2/ATP-dependent DNA helicase PcrA